MRSVTFGAALSLIGSMPAGGGPAAVSGCTGRTRVKPSSTYVKPGAVRVAVTPGDASVKATMFFQGAKRVIVALNTTGAAITTTLTAPDLAGVLTMPSYRTSSTENWATTATPRVSADAITVTLPAGSVTTFTGTFGI